MLTILSAKYNTVILCCLFVLQVVYPQTKTALAWQSGLISMNATGELTYLADKEGNILPDFSRVGYHHGDKSIPHYPAVKVINPVEGDNWENIQTVIDEISNNKPNVHGHRGTILLKRGVYRVSRSILISTSGIFSKEKVTT